MASTAAPSSSTSASKKGTSSKVASAGGQVQYVVLESGSDSVHSTTGSVIKLDPESPDVKKTRREVLIRQPSYCKILDDLKGTEASMTTSNKTSSEVTTSDEPSNSSSSVQTITINGQQYQIVSPAAAATIVDNGSGPGVVQYAAASQNGQTVFIPGTIAASAPVIAVSGASTAASPPAPVSNGGGGAGGSEEASRKREIRLMKNREAARECRNKKKEYIKCLENRVAVLENQNKALIEELKSLKELYTGQQKS